MLNPQKESDPMAVVAYLVIIAVVIGVLGLAAVVGAAIFMGLK